MKYTIAFSFTVYGTTDQMNAELKITDANTIFLGGSDAVQVQPYGTATTPPLANLRVAQTGIAFLAGPNPSNTKQALQIVVTIDSVGNALAINLSYANVILDVAYRFPGYDNQATLIFGNNTIPFPV